MTGGRSTHAIRLDVVAPEDYVAALKNAAAADDSLPLFGKFAGY